MPGDKQVFSAAMNVADRYRWDSRWAEAAQEYQRALAEFPEDAMARGGLGFCYMQTKRWQQALEEYEYTLKGDSANVIALSKTAELYGILNRRDDAYQAYLHLADLYLQAGQEARAEATWQKAVQLSPGDPLPHERLAAYYLGKKDFALMIQERLAAAQANLQRNDFAAARAQCEEILHADATNIQAQWMLSRVMAQMQQHSGPLAQATSVEFSSLAGSMADMPSDLLTFTGSPMAEMTPEGNSSGGNSGIMGNMGNFGGGGNPGPSLATTGIAGGGMDPTSRKRVTASQVTGVLRQAQTFQTQGRFNDAIDLCEQILESGFDRPDARYFLGWLYQEQQRWDDAIRQFQMLLNDPDYALSCYYALGQCYRARGDLRTATVHFDEAVDRVNLDALTMEESDQLVQLCQEAAEAHRLLGEQEQALTVYNALLGFLRSRGWGEQVAQVELMLRQMQNAPVRTATPPPAQQAPSSVLDAPTMEFNTPAGASSPASAQLPASPQVSIPGVASNSSVGELPDWLTGILSDAGKGQGSQQTSMPAIAASPAQNADGSAEILVAETRAMNPLPPVTLQSPQPQQDAAPATSTSWLTEDARPGNATHSVSPARESAGVGVEAAVPSTPAGTAVPASPAAQPPVVPATPVIEVSPVLQDPSARSEIAGLDLLSQMANAGGKDEALKQVAEAVLASTASLPENIRLQVVQAMQDIQTYINHNLLTPATETCLRVIDMAPQYLDVHQVLCEIYVRQGKVEQAITKYAILVDTYIVNGRTDDAIATYQRILQLEPNNLTYRMRLINLLASQGNKEDLLRERTLAAESYLRLGYMDRALTELEQALHESQTSVPTRLNYALALQKLGRSQQAVAEYQRVLQVDPGNITALVRWHVAMITSLGTPRATTLEVLSRIRWQLRGEGQRNYTAVAREYVQAAEAHPNNADVHFALGQIHQQAGNFDKAMEAYKLAMRDSAVEVIARVSAAQCLLTTGKPEAAIQQLEQALQNVRRSSSASIDPGAWAARPREEGEEHQAPEVEISMLLAKAYSRTGQQEQAQAILRQLKQTTTRQDEVSSTLAEISARQGNVDSALQEYIDLVHHYRSKRQTDNALNVLNEMVRMAPDDPRAHDELADIYVNRGLLDEGVAELRLLANIYLRHNQLEQAATAFQRIGNIYSDMGNMEEALTNLRRAADLDPRSMDLLREVVGFCLQLGNAPEAACYQAIIARHYFDTHQVKEAVAALQQLITIDRNNFEAYDLLGQTYQSVGEYEQASRVYRNLARVNPENSLARERLVTLQALRAR